MLTVRMTLFAFVFATPWAALLAAAGAAAMPLIIHLLHRNRYRVVTWAAMRFLLAAQRRNTRRMRLEQWILLAVRTVMVLLLVVAMAGVMPWAEQLWNRLFPDHAVLAAAGSRRTHKILVLDGSFSMALKTGDTTCFDRARSAAVQIVQAGIGGDGFSVVLMAAPPRAVVSEPSDDARKVADEVRSLHVLHGNADLVATLNTVEGMLSRSPGKFEEKEVYFVTDLQRTTWAARQAVDPLVALQKIQSQARTIFVDVGQDGANNLAVTGLILGAPLATTGGITPFTATIHNFGTEPRQAVRVEFLTGRARAAASDPPLKLNISSQAVVDVAPGQTATVNFSHKFSRPGEYAVQVRLENDALELDDSRSAVVTVKDTVPVLLVNGKPAAEGFDRATEFLQLALNPFRQGPVPHNIPARPRVLTESQFADAGLGDLTGYDCVFFCDVARLGVAEIRRLEAHLSSGGGAVFCVGPRVDLEAYNRLLYRNGEGILPAKLLGGQRAPENRPFCLYADEESYKRPPLDAFAADADRLSLMSVRFRHYLRAELPAGGRARKVLSFMPETPAAGDASVNAVRESPPLPVADPALVEWQPPPANAKDRLTRGQAGLRGQVLLLTSTVNMDWTSWPVSPSFPAFMQELLRFAIAGRLREQATLAGDPLEEYLPLAGAGLEATIYTPEGRTESAHTRDREDLSVLTWADTYTSGIYRAIIGRFPREHLFAVNVPTATDAQQACESDLARTNRDELRSAYPGWEFQIVTDPADAVHTGGVTGGGEPHNTGGLGTVVARWTLLALLVLLLVEVMLAWQFGHYSSVPGGDGPTSGRSDRVILGLAVSLAPLVFIFGFVLAHAAWTGDFLSFLPDGFRRSGESWLGIPPPAAGEGTRWRLEFLPYLWGAAADPWLAGLIAVAATGLVVAVYLREGTTARTSYKFLLASLRVCFVLLTLAVLLPQLRVWFERQGWPDVAILIDDSRSMGEADRYQDPEVQAAADRLAHLAALTNPQRLQLAQALLTRSQPDWLHALLLDRKVKVHVYHCSGRAARVGDVSDSADVEQRAAVLRAIQDLRAEGESSQLGTAVRQVLNDFRGSSLSAIVMLTDGVTTEGEDLLKASRYARQVGVPLYFVGLGDAHEVRDLQLHDLQVEDSVYVNDRVVFEARLTGQGYTDLTVPVILYEKGKPDRVLDRQLVRVDPHGKPVKVRLIHQPGEPGEQTYVIDVPTQPDEVRSTENNRLERTVFVREAKLIKVLYVEGSARYEYRFIKNLLERESAEDKRNKTIDIKVLLLDSGEEYAKQDKSALADFPTKAELNQFDVVILGDADPQHPKLGDKRLVELADFVRERGGGLLMVAGEDYGPHAYRDGPLKDILPVEASGPPPEDTDRVQGFRPELTATGRFHPIFRFSPDEAANTEIWNHLAELYWWSEGYRTKPAAEVLAVHPQAAADSARGRADAEAKERHPLIVQQFVGAGRCLFFGLDETWRWRFRDNELRFNQFWIQMVRYLARSRLGRVELRLDRQTPYRRGEPIKVTVRFPDDAPPPPPDTEVKVFGERTLTQKDGTRGTEGQTLTLAKIEGSRATYEALLTRTPEGEYRFWLSAPTTTGAKPRAECRVLVPPGEMDRLRMNREDMERAAEETQGRFFTLADADRVLDELPSGARVALNAPQPPRLLWNQPIAFALALVLLGSEWFLRKRKHLL